MYVPMPKLSNKMNAVCTATAAKFLKILSFYLFWKTFGFSQWYHGVLEWEENSCFYRAPLRWSRQVSGSLLWHTRSFQLLLGTVGGDGTSEAGLWLVEGNTDIYIQVCLGLVDGLMSASMTWCWTVKPSRWREMSYNSEWNASLWKHIWL